MESSGLQKHTSSCREWRSPQKFSSRERARLRGLSPLCGRQSSRHHRSQEKRCDPYRRGSSGREIQQGPACGLARLYPTITLSVSEHRRGNAIHERPRSPTSEPPSIQLPSTRHARSLNPAAQRSPNRSARRLSSGRSRINSPRSLEDTATPEYHRPLAGASYSHQQSRKVAGSGSSSRLDPNGHRQRQDLHGD